MTFGSVDSFSPHLWAIESKYRTHSGKLLVSSAPEFSFYPLVHGALVMSLKVTTWAWPAWLSGRALIYEPGSHNSIPG